MDELQLQTKAFILELKLYLTQMRQMEMVELYLQLINPISFEIHEFSQIMKLDLEEEYI